MADAKDIGEVNHPGCIRILKPNRAVIDKSHLWDSPLFKEISRKNDTRRYRFNIEDLP
jgi:hypothetical protein